jgi:hypothetical protein
MELLQYIFSGFFKFMGFFILFAFTVHYTVNAFLRIYSRFIRMVMVLSRGWPPKDLDADGDHIKGTTETEVTF